MKISSALRGCADGLSDIGVIGHTALLLEAADLIDATTPRPWPPQEGVERCLAWRNKEEGWGIVGRDQSGIAEWYSDQFIGMTRVPPQFWLPMPPEPEVGG